MPRSPNGDYTLPAGNPVVSGTIIDTEWANPTLSDIANEMTNSLSREGEGGMLVPLQFIDGSVTSPGMTWVNDIRLGFYRANTDDMRVTVNGTDNFRWINGGAQVWSVEDQLWYDVLTGENVIGTEIQTQTLTDGQVEVVFDNSINAASMTINGINADNGRLLEDIDYTQDNLTKTVTLTGSYPDGTTLTAIRSDTSESGQETVEGSVRNYPTLAAGQADPDLKIGMAGNMAERTTGNGGGAMWDVVLASNVTVNGYNIVACTGVPTLALVLRLDNTINIKQFGAIGDGVNDDRLAIQASINLAFSREGKSTLLFPSCDNFYNISSTNETELTSGLVFPAGNSCIVIGSEYKGVIRGTISMEYLVYAPFDTRFYSMTDIVFDANDLADYAFANDDVNTSSTNPYLGIIGCTFTNALTTGARISSFVAGLDRCIFSNSPTGLRYSGISPGPSTSTVFSNCYTLNCSNIGYDIGFLTYGTLLACASDDCGIAYQFTSAYSVSMSACGAENSIQPINFIGWRGVSIDTFYMLGCGQGTTSGDYLIEFSGGGFGATIKGIYNNQPVGDALLLGMTSATNGSESITILDNTVRRIDTFFVENSYANEANAVKFLWDESNRTQTIAVPSGDFTALQDAISGFNNKTINASTIIDISGTFPATSDLTALNIKKGDRQLLIRGDGTAIINDRLSLFNSNITFENVQFNQTGGGFETSLRLYRQSTTTLSDCRFRVTGNGGSAVHLFESSSISINNNSNVSGNFSTATSRAFENDGTGMYSFNDVGVIEGYWFPEGVLIPDNTGVLAGVMCTTNSAYVVGSTNYKEF